jgi:hypothetical protein
MADLWIDDINDEVVLNVQTKEQLKRIEERKLMEESEVALAKLLFEEKPLKEKEQNKNEQNKNLSKNTSNFSKQKENK